MTKQVKKSDVEYFAKHPVAFIEGVLGATLWGKQKDIANSVVKNRQTAVKSCHGSGKCNRIGTEILMFDGTIKKVEDVVPGDLLMGPDSRPRTVLSTTRGVGPLKKITPTKGEPWVCNDKHILTLVEAGKDELYDIEITEFERLRDKRKYDRSRLVRTGVDFPIRQKLPLPPYLVGLWIGDGTTTSPNITTADPEIVEYLFDVSKMLECQANLLTPKGGCNNVSLTTGAGSHPNHVWDALKENRRDSDGVKHIQHKYLTANRQDRLELLAGILDSDGHLDTGCFEVTSKYKHLADQYAFLARSLGFAAYVKQKKASIKSIGYEGVAWRVSISGDVDQIPCKLPRKQAAPRRQRKSVLRTNFTIEDIGEGEYAGFELDGDGRYLLADFTITHNSFLAARLALWWLFTRPYSAVITTAPTGRQVKDILWKEIRSAYHGSKFPLGGNLMPKACQLDVDNNWILTGFSTDDSVNFQGWHSRGGTLIIFDEGPGVAPEIWEVIRGVLVDADHDRFLAIGNPVEKGGPFYEMFKSDSAASFHISAFDVPNVIEKRQVFPGLCTYEWVEDRRKEWPEHSPMWQSRVLGEFPDVDSRSLVPLSWIADAFARHKKQRWPDDAKVYMGVDLAAGGENKTVYSRFYDHIGVRELVHAPMGQRMPDTVQQTIALAREWGVTEIRFDGDGIGQTFGPYIEEVMPEDMCVSMRGGMPPDDGKDDYLNCRAQWYWHLRNKLDPTSERPYVLPENEDLRSQLSNIHWQVNQRGKIQIESKKDMKSRGMASPDEADSCMYGAANRAGNEFIFI